jgi:H+-translocating NAD(P) transhydrogenase subunit alpha
MIVGVPKETYPGERRVAMVPSVIPILLKAGCEVLIEKGAGLDAGYEDYAYTSKGAKLAATRAEVFATSDIVIQVLCHGANDKTGEADLPLIRPARSSKSPRPDRPRSPSN